MELLFMYLMLVGAGTAVLMSVTFVPMVMVYSWFIEKHAIKLPKENFGSIVVISFAGWLCLTFAFAFEFLKFMGKR